MSSTAIAHAEYLLRRIRQIERLIAISPSDYTAYGIRLLLIQELLFTSRRSPSVN